MIVNEKSPCICHEGQLQGWRLLCGIWWRTGVYFRAQLERVVRGSRCTVTGLTINGMDVWQNENGSILLAHPDKEEMWVPASLCMASDKWMGIRDENSAVYITLEEVPYTIAAKLAYLEKFRWTV